MVDLCRQNEVVFSQAAGGVGPEVDPQGAVGKVEVWVVALALDDRSDPVDELDSRHEALEFEVLGELEVAVALDDAPTGKLPEETVDLGRGQCGRLGRADLAVPLGERGGHAADRTRAG